MYNDILNKKLITTAERKDMLTQVTRLKDTQTYNQANPSVFLIQRSRVQTRQNREHIK